MVGKPLNLFSEEAALKTTLSWLQATSTNHDQVSMTTSQSTNTLSVVGIFMVVFESVLMVVICVVNVLLLIGFFFNKRLHKNITNFYLMHLALADFITGAFAIFHILAQVWYLMDLLSLAVGATL